MGIMPALARSRLSSRSKVGSAWTARAAISTSWGMGVRWGGTAVDLVHAVIGHAGQVGIIVEFAAFAVEQQDAGPGMAQGVCKILIVVYI